MTIVAIVMAGGKGERRRPLTETRPKSMLPVVDTPILQHELLEANGIRESFVALHCLPGIVRGLRSTGRVSVERLHAIMGISS